MGFFDGFFGEAGKESGLSFVVDGYVRDCGLDSTVYKEALKPKTPRDRNNTWLDRERIDGSCCYWGLMAYVLAGGEALRVEALRALVTLTRRSGKLDNLEEFVSGSGVRISASDGTVDIVTSLYLPCSQGTEFVVSDGLIRDFTELVKKDTNVRNHLVEAVVYGSLSSVYPKEFRLCILRSLGKLLGTLEDGKGCLARNASFRANLKLDWLGPASAAKRPRTAPPPPPPPWGSDFRDQARSSGPAPFGSGKSSAAEPPSRHFDQPWDDNGNEQSPDATRVMALETQVNNLNAQLEVKRLALEIADAQLRAAISQVDDLSRRLKDAEMWQATARGWNRKLFDTVGSAFDVLDIPIAEWNACNREEQIQRLRSAYHRGIKKCYYIYGHDDPRYDENTANAMGFRQLLLELAREFLQKKYNLS